MWCLVATCWIFVSLLRLLACCVYFGVLCFDFVWNWLLVWLWFWLCLGLLLCYTFRENIKLWFADVVWFLIVCLGLIVCLFICFACDFVVGCCIERFVVWLCINWILLLFTMLAAGFELLGLRGLMLGYMFVVYDAFLLG